MKKTLNFIFYVIFIGVLLVGVFVLIRSWNDLRKMRERVTELEDEVRQKNESLIPMGRYGTIEEFGKAGAFLLSVAASYITGASLVVDGGLLKEV